MLCVSRFLIQRVSRWFRPFHLCSAQYVVGFPSSKGSWGPSGIPGIPWIWSHALQTSFAQSVSVQDVSFWLIRLGWAHEVVYRCMYSSAFHSGVMWILRQVLQVGMYVVTSLWMYIGVCLWVSWRICHAAAFGASWCAIGVCLAMFMIHDRLCGFGVEFASGLIMFLKV